MKIKSFLYVLLFTIFAVSCENKGEIVDNNPNEGGGTEEPSLPTEPAYIRFGCNYVSTDYEGGAKSIVVDVNPDWIWEITTSGEEWFSAERVENDLVVTFNESSDKLERRGTTTVKIGVDENIAEATVNVLQIGTDTEELIYEVETTVPNQDVIAAPILTYQNGGKMTVDWGDGSTLATYENQRVYKTYAEPGIYTITISGEDIHNLEFSNGKLLCYELKRIHSWGKMGYKMATDMCKGCVNLESIPNDVAGSFSDVGSFVHAFLGCESLKEIPAGLFRHAAKAKRFEHCFQYAASICEIPENLFANSPLAEDFRYAFYGTGTDFEITDDTMTFVAGEYKDEASFPANLETAEAIENGNLTSIPEGLFRSCPNAADFQYVFGVTAITTIPEGLFAENSAATNYEGLFFECRNFKSVPANFMKNATAATNIKNMFKGCRSLTEVPVAMFENCSEVENIVGIFSYAGIKEAKRGLFKGLSKVKTVGAVFNHCTALSSVEDGLFEGLSAAESFEHCFAECTSLRTIPSGLLAGMNNAYHFKYMFKNIAVESVPEGLFDEVKDDDLANYAYTFSECKNLKTVPAKLFDHVIETSSRGFSNLFYQSGIETIPAGLFSTFTKADADCFYEVFNDCPELHTVEGSIFPEVTTITLMERLFLNCPKLKNIPADLFKPLGAANKLNFSYAFANCTSLQTLPEGLFDANTGATGFQHTFEGCTALESIPATLLYACANVTNVSYLFAGCSSLKDIPAALFANNPKIQDFNYTFKGCSSLEAIPETLFSAIGTESMGISFSSCFANCSSLKDIPAALFDTVTKIRYIDNCFNGCSALTGESPYTTIGEKKVHLYERQQKDGFRVINEYDDCFKGCSGLSDYANMPMAWR